MTEWIPVDEKLPEVGENVLVYYKSDNRIEMDKRTGFCYMSGQPVWITSLMDSVSHWMPLPKPPISCVHEEWAIWLDISTNEKHFIVDFPKRTAFKYCPNCGVKAGDMDD